MKVLVLGCGSIGTRRAKILVDMGHEVHGVDPKFGEGWTVVDNWHPANGVGVRWLVETGATGAGGSFDPEEDYDVALICTPPDSGRAEQVRELRELVTNVHGLFIEKPLALTLDEVDAIKARSVRYLVTMGACNLRFSEGVDALRKIEGPRVGFFQMGMHRKYWSAGHQPVSLILDSIHELDLAAWAMGPIMNISGKSTEDEASISVHHAWGYSLIYLNRSSDPPIREAMVHRYFDGIGTREMIHINTDPSMYVREMQHFMDCVEAGVPTCNPIEDAAEVCRWALEVA